MVFDSANQSRTKREYQGYQTVENNPRRPVQYASVWGQLPTFLERFFLPHGCLPRCVRVSAGKGVLPSLATAFPGQHRLKLRVAVEGPQIGVFGHVFPGKRR